MTESAPDEIKITAQPLTEETCRFTVDRPLSAERSYYFAGKDAAIASPLARRLFEIAGVANVLISHDEVTVTKGTPDPWQALGKAVGTAIREQITSGEAAIATEVWDRLPPEDEIRDRVQTVLDQEINPAVAAHGGVIALLDVRSNSVYLKMGGGCQGCGMASVTLKQGVEKAIRGAIPEVGDILDVTDHAAGRNPYYAASG